MRHLWRDLNAPRERNFGAIWQSLGKRVVMLHLQKKRHAGDLDYKQQRGGTRHPFEIKPLWDRSSAKIKAESGPVPQIQIESQRQSFGRKQERIALVLRQANGDTVG